MGCGCVQGGHPQAAAVGQVGTNLLGVKRDVAEKSVIMRRTCCGWRRSNRRKASKMCELGQS